MSQGFTFYDARANESAQAAEIATLDNVRDRNLRSEKTWRALAEQARKVEEDRAKAEVERQSRREAEAAEAAEAAVLEDAHENAYGERHSA